MPTMAAFIVATRRHRRPRSKSKACQQMTGTERHPKPEKGGGLMSVARQVPVTRHVVNTH